MSGTVYDPAGRVPLSNAVVFVPDDPAGTLPEIPLGTNSCSSCDAPVGKYVVATTSDINGNFKLGNVPATKHVPFVVQIGKWRREVFLSSVTACQDNPVDASASRLPARRSEGNLPQMAISTGHRDDLGCFLHDIGIADSEYSAPHAGGRLDVYAGAPFGGSASPGLSSGTAGDCTTASCPLWSTKADLESYDIVLLACEGTENLQSKPASAMQAMHDWLDEGGKVFATHYHYVWFDYGPAPFPTTATWLGMSDGTGGGNYAIDTSFPKGMLFDQWLASPKVAAIAATGAPLSMTGVADSVSAYSGPPTGPTSRWVYDSSTNHPKYISFLTPIGGSPSMKAGEGPTYCGKAVFSDLHAGGMPSGDLPASCGTAAPTPQERALEYLFFDLSSCVSDDSKPPAPPPGNPPK